MLSISTEATGIHPLARIAPVIPVAHIGDPVQELNARATQFSKGTHYPALVTSKLEDGTFLVKVGLASYKMDLGQNVNIGQQLLLQYLNDFPVPTFALMQKVGMQIDKTSDATANVSAAAHLIDNTLKQAQAAGVSARFEATNVVTRFPAIPQFIAQNLKSAVEQSGLFYESHLKQFHEGHRSLSELHFEPQNQPGTQNALLPQQLAILENHRLSWHGEIWPGQKMDWDVQLKNGTKDEHASNAERSPDSQSVFTELVLELPRLGKVSAKISLVDGHMRIGLLAQNAEACSIMQAQSAGLAGAIKRNGQKLEGLQVASHE